MAPRVLIPVECGVSAAPLIAKAQEEFGRNADIFLGHVHPRDALTTGEFAQLTGLFREAHAAQRAGIAVRVITTEADDFQEGISALDRAIGADVVAARGDATSEDYLEPCFVEQSGPISVISRPSM